MPDEAQPVNIRRKPYTPNPEIQGLLRVSGNPINGLSRRSKLRAFWNWICCRGLLS